MSFNPLFPVLFGTDVNPTQGPSVIGSVTGIMQGNVLGGLQNTTSSILPWYLQGKVNGVDPTLWVDFVNNRYAVNNVERSYSDIFTTSRSGPGTRFNSSGLLVVEAADTPRFDYDPLTLQPKGILFEEARTNTFPQNNIDSLGGMSTWQGITAADTTPNAAIAPDGTNTAFKIADGTGTGSKRTYRTGGGYVSGTTYTFSLFAKAAEHNKFSLSGESPTFGTFYAVFTLSGSGSVISDGALYSSIQNIGNGWYRCSITKAATATYGDGFAIGLTNNTDAFLPAYTGTNSGIYIWGIQDEAGIYPSSYIPTTTASVTRPSEIITNTSTNTIPTSAWATGATAETAFASAQQIRTNLASRIIDPQGGNGIGMLWQRNAVDAVLSWTIPSFDRGDISLPHGGSFGSIEKYAAAVADTDMAGVVNGGTIVTDNTVKFGVRDMLIVGNRTDLARAFNGWIREVRIWPIRATNTELQRITT